MQGTIHLLRKHIFVLFGPSFPLYKQILYMKMSQNYHFISSNQEIYKSIMEQYIYKVAIYKVAKTFAQEILQEQSEHSTDSLN